MHSINEVFQTAPENNIQTRGSFQKLKCPFRKTNAGQWRCLTLVQPYGAKPLRRLSKQNLNMFKHNLKEHYLKELKNSNSS